MIPNDIEKLKTSQYLRFINTTPSAQNPTWKVLGIGITELATSYNPQVETEQWIIEDTARNDHTGNQKQSSVTQKCYKNDPTFEFINGCRDKLNCVTQVLEVDTWNGTGGSYPSKLSNALVAVTSYSGAEVEYDLYFNGDPTDGNSTITGGTPSFTPSVSL